MDHDIKDGNFLISSHKELFDGEQPSVLQDEEHTPCDMLEDISRASAKNKERKKICVDMPKLRHCKYRWTDEEHHLLMQRLVLVLLMVKYVVIVSYKPFVSRLKPEH